MIHVLLSSCSAAVHTLPEEKISPNRPFTESEPTVSPDDVKKEDSFVVLQFEPFTRISSNKRAAFFLRVIHDKFQPKDTGYYYLIAFVTDFESAITHPLCTTPGCRHDSPGCMAWIKRSSTASALFLIAAEDKLFWISGSPDRPNNDDIRSGTNPSREEYYAYIDVSDLDGSNKNRLYTAIDDESIDHINILYDGNSLVYVENGRQAYTDKALVVLDAEAGKVRSRFVLPGDYSILNSQAEHFIDRIDLTGLYNNEALFILSEYLTAATPVVKKTTSVFTINLKTGQQTDYINFQAESESDFWFQGTAWTGSEFIEFNRLSREFFAVDIATGAERVIGALPEEMDEISFLQSIFGTHILAYAHSPYRPFYIDIETGTVIDDDSFMFEGFFGTRSHSLLVAETGKEYLMLTDVRHYDIDSPMQYSDTTINSAANRYEYVMISKENYWNGTHDYREIMLIE